MADARELMGLSGHAMLLMTGGRNPEFWLTGDGALALSGEPVADFNLAFVWPGPGAQAFTGEAIRRAAARQSPMLLLAHPDAAPAAEAEGMERAGETPLMVLPADALATSGSRRCEIRRAVTPDLGASACAMIATAFSLPPASVARVYAPLLAASGPAEVFVALDEGTPVSTVTVTRHGATLGVWSMATPPDLQGRGWGRALLAGLLAAQRQAGTEQVFLYATEAGRPLYRALGFSTAASLPTFVASAPGEGERP